MRRRNEEGAVLTTTGFMADFDEGLLSGLLLMFLSLLLLVSRFCFRSCLE